MNSVSVKNLEKNYKNERVFKSISFDVGKGQIFAFLGPNGAGKSTTMNILSTLLEKSAGTVSVSGFDIDKNRRKIKSEIGVVFQNDVLDVELSVYDNLVFRCALYHKKREDIEKNVLNVIKTLSLYNVLDKKYGECSGGQRRLVQIARALLSNPSLLILDEPTTGLDPAARKLVWQTLVSLRDSLNITIFYTTHYLEEALYADRYCILNNGKIVNGGNISSLTHESGRKNASIFSIYDDYCRLLSGE